MALWEWLVDSAGLILAVVLLYAVGLIVRRRLVAGRGSTFELSVRLYDGPVGRGWVLGFGRYQGDRVEWFRIFSLWPRPKRSWARRELTYVGQRSPEGAERLTLYAGHLVVTCATPTGEVDLAMSPSALTGLQAWLEAAPPGATHR